jgi:hypothetical protein
VTRLWLPAAGIAVVLAAVFRPQPALTHVTTTNTVLFDREIVRILDRHCVGCHAERALSFPLETYEQTWLRGRPVLAEVLARHMPPWAAVPGYGAFANDNSLTLRETQFLVSWVEGLGPRNAGTVFLNVQDPGAAPPPPVRADPSFDRWHLGEPDVTRQLAALTVDAGAPDGISRTVIDVRQASTRQLRGLEYRPGDRRVVRAAFFTIQETGQWLGSWTPWYGFAELPAPVSYRLPAGSHIAVEIHYRGTSERVVERGSLGLFFGDSPAPKAPSDLVLDARGEVRVGAAAQRFRADARLDADTWALALWPRIEPGIQSLEVSARRPDGGTEILLFARDLSPEWPTPYIFEAPVELLRGTVLSVTAYYANATASPRPGGVTLTVSRYD